MSAVERVQQFCNIPPEILHKKHFLEPPDDWPQYGIIAFENLSYSHQKDGPLVLNNILFNVKSKEKVRMLF